MDELVSNHNSEDYVQDIGNGALESNLEEVRSSTSNKENQKFKKNFTEQLMLIIPLQNKKDCLYYKWNCQY